MMKHTSFSSFHLILLYAVILGQDIHSLIFQVASSLGAVVTYGEYG